ncbi:hypothetical protein HYPSUDRAFT_186492 [Hypholoma sublateritium FD-334 SS-4]|uniref:Ketoreductase (KR) domain-containing protein n=1 Tax=Hypholoma sublateritium (strain FD-334 SS-4) TaxID=945553 RepID=A0A0D2L625_HYPSF|nr:hypothetical protein HYPSUDRAFT_186492 [Hypholoma sublateritium FD-334 SS-4]
MSPSTIYLVTGSNRGLGLGFVSQILAAHDNAFVYAGAREPEKATGLKSLAAKYPGRMAIVKCVSADVEGISDLAKYIEKGHGRVDTVIANAGLGIMKGSVSEVSVAALEDHFRVNVIGTIVLFQSLYSLLKKSHAPRFIPISTAAAAFHSGVIELPFGSAAYGTTKVALNWATRKIHFENDWLVSFPMNPGPVDTDMLRNNVSSDTSGTFENMLSVYPILPSGEMVAESLLKVIDNSTRAKEGGEFIDVDGTKLAW